MTERDRKLIEWLKASRQNPHAKENLIGKKQQNWKAYLQNRRTTKGTNGCN